MTERVNAHSLHNRLLDAICSKSGIRLLRLFLFKSDIEMHQAEVIDRSGLSRMTTTKFLKIFESNGILSESKKGDLKLYSINHGNPIIKQLKILVNVTEIYEYIKGLSGESTEVFLFGSAARGEDTDTSDIDLLVITGLDKPTIANTLGRLKNNMRREINPLIYTSMEYSRLALTDKVFYENFEKDKIRLI